MIEVSMTELFLMLWAVGASATAGHYYSLALERKRMLMGASMFIKRLVVDDEMRDQLRVILSKTDADDVELKFGEMK